MLNGHYKDRKIGSGTDVWAFCEAVSRGDMTQQQFNEAESCMSRSAGHCMTMGTASHNGLNGGSTRDCSPHQRRHSRRR